MLSSLKIFLPWAGLIFLIITRGSVASTANCRLSNCKINVTDKCQNATHISCDQSEEPIQKIQITKTSFPKHVRKIDIRNVNEIEIQADAIGSLASLVSIKLKHIGTLTLLPRSLARTSESGPMSVIIWNVANLQLHSETFADWRNPGSEITIHNVEECHMSQKTIAPLTLIRDLKLLNITTLTVDSDAIAEDSIIDTMWLSEVTNLTVGSGAFAPNTTIKSMHLRHITSMTLRTGAFARNSSVENLMVNNVSYLLIESGGIQADISELTISDVCMATCEENTFGSTIQSMSLTSSYINIIKPGCISATLEETLSVSAAEVITLKNCNVTVLKKDAFSMLKTLSYIYIPYIYSYISYIYICISYIYIPVQKTLSELKTYT